MRAMHHFDSRAVALLLKDLSKVGATAQAFTLFDWLRSLPPHNRLGILCDVYTYTACISLCMSHKGLDRALALLEDMKTRGIERNVHTYTALMNVCIKTGNLPTALDMFQQMRQAGCSPNVVTYNTLIDVYGKLGQWDRAAQVLSVMRSQVRRHSGLLNHQQSFVEAAGWRSGCQALAFLSDSTCMLLHCCKSCLPGGPAVGCMLWAKGTGRSVQGCYEVRGADTNSALQAHAWSAAGMHACLPIAGMLRLLLFM
jgi:pentatricopeptide repeat protein